MAMSQHFDSDPFWPAALLAGSLPTGHLEQRQQQPAVRGIPIDVVEVSRLFVSCNTSKLARKPHVTSGMFWAWPFLAS